MILMNEPLRDKLVAHYERVKAEVSKCESVADALGICRRNHVDFGICLCCIHIIPVDVFHCDWINSKRWGLYPYSYQDMPNIITALQTRIDILKTFPN
jgi:hypothetical protein